MMRMWTCALAALLLCACGQHRRASEPAAAGSGPSWGGTPGIADMRADADAATTPRAAPAEDAGAAAEIDDGGSVATGRPLPGVEDAAVGPADAGPQAPAVIPAELTFEVTTKASPDAAFGPLNVVAVWVEDAAGVPIKILGQWGAISTRALTVYVGQVVPLLGRPSVLAPFREPDVVTTATQRSHGTRTAVWHMTDPQGEPVAQGIYRIVAECAEDNDGSVVTSVEFEYGPEPQSIDVDETDEFGPLRLRYTPAVTP